MARPSQRHRLAHEADEVDEEGFAYSVAPLHGPTASIGEERCLKGAREALQEGMDSTVMILGMR